ncbi:hypothetical protein OD350_29020 (plasmid) [Clostridium beijerinckii]|uniref:hypothetical protein n=1 Tax=Clostridium beijerinckii TaxID=1520 RepID=UPI002226D744|nr:hypothetical protein [Clostridium beijerinckii]UYZ39117.1 hypothetical protein OD350_29020 [Clostridium beijerinckii]
MKIDRSVLRVTPMHKQQIKIISKFFNMTMTEYINSRIFDEGTCSTIEELLKLRIAYFIEGNECNDINKSNDIQIKIDLLDEVIVNFTDTLNSKETELTARIDFRATTAQKEKIKSYSIGMTMSDYINSKLFNYDELNDKLKEVLKLRAFYCNSKRNYGMNTLESEKIQLKIWGLDNILIDLIKIVNNENLDL